MSGRLPDEDNYVPRVFDVLLVLRWDQPTHEGFELFYQIVFYPIVQFLRDMGFVAEVQVYKKLVCRCSGAPQNDSLINITPYSWACGLCILPASLH